MARPLRLMIFDRTCRGRPGLPLTYAWAAGGPVYGALGRLDAWQGVASWAEAASWLAGVSPGAAIAEVQVWAHGRWGNARLGDDVLDEAALATGHPLGSALGAVRRRLEPGAEALWWFRTCETFGTERGLSFARAFARFLGCRVAGHTFRIGLLQSGLHSLAPGAEPAWPANEGLPPGLPAPQGAESSRWGAPNTITCLTGSVPPGY